MHMFVEIDKLLFKHMLLINIQLNNFLLTKYPLSHYSINILLNKMDKNIQIDITDNIK